MIFREGRRRALSSREPWNRGNRTVHGFHGSTAHGSTVQPWNRAAVEPCGHGWSRGFVERSRGGSAVKPWSPAAAARLHGSAVEP